MQVKVCPTPAAKSIRGVVDYLTDSLGIVFFTFIAFRQVSAGTPFLQSDWLTLARMKRQCGEVGRGDRYKSKQSPPQIPNAQMGGRSAQSLVDVLVPGKNVPIEMCRCGVLGCLTSSGVFGQTETGHFTPWPRTTTSLKYIYVEIPPTGDMFYRLLRAII